MKFQIIKFSSDYGEPKNISLGISGIKKLQNDHSRNHALVLVIKETEMALLLEMNELFIDRGKKDSRKGLAAHLLSVNSSKIPAIMGDYSSCGVARNGIKKFLAQAKQKKANRLFAVSLPDELFQTIWNENSNTEKTSNTSTSKETPLESTFPAIPLSEKMTSLENTPSTPARLAHLMNDVDVPDELKSRYLGNSMEYQLVRKMILLASQSDVPVLILGPTGSGKERVAQLIHYLSDRKDGPFITINCGAIPQDLFETEIFGHVKGSFTGAISNKIGKWELANKGTLFLDEIGDVLPSHQVKLLRALEDNSIQPVGSSGDRPVDARIIAATNKNLFSMVKNEHFREDLYYRLRVFPIRTPAIKDNPVDIAEMVRTFWRKLNPEPEKMLSDDVITAIQNHPWPGNVRQIRSVLDQLQVLFGDKKIRPEHFYAAMSLEGDEQPKEIPTDNSNSKISHHLAACLQHLRRVDEAVHATIASIDPMLGKNNPYDISVEYIAGILRHQLNELEILFKEPLLFGSQETFIAIYHLKGKLTYFDSLLYKNMEAAKEYWNGEIRSELDSALSKILFEIEKALDQT